MILPLRVLGEGFGEADLVRLGEGMRRSACHHRVSSFFNASVGLRLASSVTKAAMPWPFISCGMPTQAASATASWATRALSISIVPGGGPRR